MRAEAESTIGYTDHCTFAICLPPDVVSSARDFLMGLEVFETLKEGSQELTRTREALERALIGTQWAFRQTWG